MSTDQLPPTEEADSTKQQMSGGRVPRLVLGSSDTPETDVKTCWADEIKYAERIVPATIARKLEREKNELVEENRHLKDMIVSLSKTHAADMQRLSDMIDRRNKAGREIMEAANGNLTGLHMAIHRNAPIFLSENAEPIHGGKEPKS